MQVKVTVGMSDLEAARVVRMLKQTGMERLANDIEQEFDAKKRVMLERLEELEKTAPEKRPTYEEFFRGLK